jgi:flavin-dependent dehydrogenase
MSTETAEGMYDVAVVGGGPAGATTARRIALLGRSVALLERSHYDRPRVGETLAPVVQPLLKDLGVWDRFSGLGALPSWGTRSIWGASAPAANSHLMSGYGCGWHIDRLGFDRMLADAAVSAGAVLHTGTSVVRSRYDNPGWQLVTGTGEAIRCRVLVDATGRRAAVGRALGARRWAFDRLTAVAGICKPINVEQEQYLLVEAVADGWWYSAPQPEGAVISMLMTDADVCRRHGLADPADWQAHMRLAPWTAKRIGGVRPAMPPTVHPAASHRLLRDGDPRPWLAVGDAALAVDPVSGSGVPRALRTAQSATAAVSQILDHDGAASITSYERARNDECTAYLTERAWYYAMENRYRSPFWARRTDLGGLGRSEVHQG